jgi:hypothetical protein
MAARLPESLLLTGALKANAALRKHERMKENFIIFPHVLIMQAM